MLSIRVSTRISTTIDASIGIVLITRICTRTQIPYKTSTTIDPHTDTSVVFSRISTRVGTTFSATLGTQTSSRIDNCIIPKFSTIFGTRTGTRFITIICTQTTMSIGVIVFILALYLLSGWILVSVPGLVLD